MKIIKWKEPVWILNAIENKADKKAGGQKERLIWLFVLPIVFAMAPLAFNNAGLVNMTILFFIGLAFGIGLYIYGYSTTSMIQTVEINKKGILRIYIGSKMANHFISWNGISFGQVEYLVIKGKRVALLNLYESEDELIVTLALSQELSTKKLSNVFEQYGCELII